MDPVSLLALGGGGILLFALSRFRAVTPTSNYPTPYPETVSSLPAFPTQAVPKTTSVPSNEVQARCFVQPESDGSFTPVYQDPSGNYVVIGGQTNIGQHEAEVLINSYALCPGFYSSVVPVRCFVQPETDGTFSPVFQDSNGDYWFIGGNKMDLASAEKAVREHPPCIASLAGNTPNTLPRCFTQKEEDGTFSAVYQGKDGGYSYIWLTEYFIAQHTSLEIAEAALLNCAYCPGTVANQGCNWLQGLLGLCPPKYDSGAGGGGSGGAD